MKMFKRIMARIQESKKREALYYLRRLPDSQLENFGYSPLLVKQGINTWPWRAESESDEVTELDQLVAEQQKSIQQLHKLSDVELDDLGISRSSIKKAVLFGHPGIEHETTDKVA